MTDIDPNLLDQCIRDSGISFKENTQSFIFDCPRCGKEKKLYIRKRDGRFTCWVCSETDGFHGSAEWALVELLSLPISDIKAALGLVGYTPKAEANLGFKLRDWFNFEQAEDDRQLVEYDSEFINIVSLEAKLGRDYLESRGIPLEIAVEYDLKYNPRTGRVIIPVKEHGQLYGWQARATRPTEWIDRVTGEERKVPKILTLPTMQKGRHLMFYDRLIGSEHAIICEGPFDALKCHLAGGNVATMGKLVTQEQVDMVLATGVKRVYLALDPDAQMEMQILAPKFHDVEVFMLLPGPGFKDLGEMSLEGVLGRFHTAPRLRLGHITPNILP